MRWTEVPSPPTSCLTYWPVNSSAFIPACSAGSFSYGGVKDHGLGVIRHDICYSEGSWGVMYLTIPTLELGHRGGCHISRIHRDNSHTQKNRPFPGMRFGEASFPRKLGQEAEERISGNQLRRISSAPRLDHIADRQRCTFPDGRLLQD